MIIGFDASAITPNKAGIGYYTYSLLLELSKIREVDIYAYTNNLSNIPEELQKTKIKFEEIPADRPNYQWILKVADEFDMLGLKEAVFISPSNFTFGILIKNSLSVVHDLAPVKFKGFFPKKGMLVYNLQLWLLKRRRRQIVVPSESVKSDLVEFGFKSENVTVILEGVHEWAKSPVSQKDIDTAREFYQLPDKYILSLSTLEPRKNHLSLLRAFAKFNRDNPDYYLVFVGKKGWFYSAIFEEVERLKIKEKVVFAGYVPEEDVASILDGCELMVNISYYEGFALPLIEAGIRGKKLVASNIPVYKEIIQDNALYCEPNDVDCIAEKIEEALKSKIETKSDFFDRYSWQKAALQFVDEAKTVIRKE